MWWKIMEDSNVIKGEEIGDSWYNHPNELLMSYVGALN
jgi:hypothetical protein